MSHEAITAHFRVTIHDGGRGPQRTVFCGRQPTTEKAPHIVWVSYDMGSIRHGRQSPFWPGFAVIHRPFNDRLHLCRARVSDKRRRVGGTRSGRGRRFVVVPSQPGAVVTTPD